MAKNFLHDIKPTMREERRTRIDSTELPESDRSMNLPPRFRERSYVVSEPGRSHKFLWMIAIIVIIVGGLMAWSYMAKATVTVIPKSESVALSNEVFSATLVGSDKTLSFKLVKLSGSADKAITGGTVTDIQTKATGRVIVYNNFSSTPQKLAIETRLATADGKLFKTDTAFTVPGQKTEGGKLVPGSIEVGVHSDLAGPTYNIPLSDFTIVGFKGTPKYTKFYARSKTAMTGGANGKGIALSEADKLLAHQAATGLLTDKLIAEVRAGLPDDQVLLPGAYVIREDADSGMTSSEKSVLTAKGSIYGVLFNREELTKKIAESTIPDYDSANIHILSLDKIAADIKNKETLSDTTATLSFSLSGDSIAVWDVPQTAIIDALRNAKKRDAAVILANFGSVKEASIKINPFWSMRLPKKAEKITLVVTEPTDDGAAKIDQEAN